MEAARRWTVNPRLLVSWIGILALAQAVDVISTQIDMERGGIEANSVTVRLLGMGGIGLLVFVKLLCVLAVVVAAVLIHRRAARNQAWRVTQVVLWRGVQVSSLVLVVIAFNNLAVLTSLI